VKASVARAMEQCGLTHMARRIVGQLSKGYRQRVGLADALVGRPKILILDEPTGGLDPHQRKEVLDLIRDLAEEHTILLSSHVLAEVETISDRVMIIQHGRLLAVGEPAELALQLQEAPRVVCEVQGPEEEARRALEELRPEERGAAELAALEDGWVRATLQPGFGVDPRVRLAEALQRRNLPVRELRRVVFSLEELFLRITAQSAQEPGP
jgi:ABC-2 type transport system ATP-binding protein